MTIDEILALIDARCYSFGHDRDRIRLNPDLDVSMSLSHVYQNVAMELGELARTIRHGGHRGPDERQALSTQS